jgi:hypothetical protein
MDPKRLREIAKENNAGNSSEVFAAVAQAAYESSMEMRQQYLDCLHGIDLPQVPNCGKCRAELLAEGIKEGRREVQKKFRSLMHVKGWDE